ncbi:MAG TPA: glycoside hydrolase domain-containing protein [Ktedonobacteraceae bacterium]|nr:glycoside hydrolase domain-containing protein [Ktedonobacteraceae bacterium]
MEFGLDYVSGPPIAAMKAAGVSFVCRYLAPVNPETQVKLLSPQEARALGAAGIALVSNFEWYASRPLEGYASGVADAQLAAQQHAVCGGPATRPIYFSVDEGVTGEQVVAYFQGVASVLGLARTGAYGSYAVLQYLFNAGAIRWGWQTYAWSNGLWEPRAQLQQYANRQTLAGASVDYDRATVSDYGQWFPGGKKAMIIDTSMPVVAAYFTQVDADHWQCNPTGKIIQYSILNFYRGYGNAELCGLTYLGLPLSNEIPLDSKGNTKQFFERGVLFYDPLHVWDNPPGSGQVYLAHLYSGPGQDPEIAALQGELQQAQAQVASLQAELAKPAPPPTPDPLLADYTNRLNQIETLAKLS